MKWRNMKLFLAENQEFNNENQVERAADEKDTKDFIEFTAFLISQRLSFSQIEIIGKYLQKAFKENKLKFLSRQNFDQR